MAGMWASIEASAHAAWVAAWGGEPELHQAWLEEGCGTVPAALPHPTCLDMMIDSVLPWLLVRDAASSDSDPHLRREW